jgi:pimeloyl-ACP methyl ester carboxylesterase
MRSLIERMERQFAWSQLRTGGHDWRWLDSGGAGPTVVLLPGSVGDGAMFVRPFLALGSRMRLVAVSYPAISRPDVLAEGLEAVCEHLALPPIVLVGSSFGAYWAQFFALRAPGRVRRLVLGNSFVDGSDLASNPLFDRKRVESSEAGSLHAEWLARVHSSPPGKLRDLQLLMLGSRQTPENLYARFLGVVRAEPCPPLAMAPENVTILSCENDPLIPEPVRRRVEDVYAGARKKRLPFGGHYPHVLNPAAYVQALLDACHE